MKLSPEEVEQLRKRGLYLTECCDDCRLILNQTWRWTIKGREEVYCSESERDRAFENLKRRGDLKDGPVMPRREATLPQIKPETVSATSGRNWAPTPRRSKKREIRGDA